MNYTSNYERELGVDMHICDDTKMVILWPSKLQAI